MKANKSISLTATILLVLLIGCKNAFPEGLYKWYYGEPIGDFLNFEQNQNHISNDTIFYKNKPIGVIISKRKRIDGGRLITVQEIGSKRRATYIKK